VQSAGFTSFLPIVMRGGVWAVDIAGQNQQRSENHTASMRFITPGYFPAMGIPLRRGRGVEESDGQTALPVALVSESFVQRYWPGQNAIGRRFQIASGTRTIVEVAGNVMVRRRSIFLTGRCATETPSGMHRRIWRSEPR
jgi:putative ABC transport system permease protein